MSSAPSAADPGTDLAAWAATGDRQALDRVLGSAADLAYAQAYRLLGRAADADDATQEALVQLARSARRYDASRPFRPWLARLVHDACCRVLRAGRRRRRHEAAAATTSTAMSESIDTDAVRAAVLALPEAYRAAVELHYFAGLSQAEAAQALGIGEGACAMRLSRARDRLRPLLQRYGVGATATVALIAMTTGPAHAAPVGVAVQVSALAAAGQLPATTIPISILRNGVWFMRGHPLAGVIATAALITATVMPFVVVGGEAPSPMPPAKPASELSAQARALLPYLDPAAPFRLAIDLHTLRAKLPSTKLGALLNDPQAAQTFAAVHAQLRRQANAQRGDGNYPVSAMFATMLEHGNALTLALRTRGADDTPENRQGWALCALDAGRGAEGLFAEFQASVAALKARMRGDIRDANVVEAAFTSPAQIGAFVGVKISGQQFGGRHGDQLVACSAEWLHDRIAAHPAPEPPAPIWFQLNASDLIASYAKLAGTDGDPAGVGNVLGPLWKTMKPIVEGSISIVGGDIRGSVVVTSAAPMSPMVPLTLCLGGAAEHPLGMMTAWPIRRPRIGIAPSADRIASLSLGLTPQAGPSPFVQRLEFVTDKINRLRASGESARFASDLLLDVLETWWSGDVAVEVRPGVPLPKVALVMGLRSDAESAAVLRLIRTYLALPDAAGDSAPVVMGGLPLGQYTLSAGSDRIFLTWNAELADWPGIATATAPANAPGCALWVDSPTVVRQWGGFALSALTSEQRRLIPPLQTLAKHLPVWTVDWYETSDGCRIDERGLFIVAYCALATLAAATECNPEQETKLGREHLERMRLQPSPPSGTTPQPGVF